MFCKLKKALKALIQFFASLKNLKKHELIFWKIEKNEYLLISARWNSRIRIRFWIGSERSDNMMHQKDCLTPRILFSSQIQD